MLSVFMAFCLSLPAQAAPTDLLALKPAETTGTVQKTASGSTELSAGLFGAAAIYHKQSFAGRSYDMKATFARTRGSDGVGFVIPVGTQKVALVLGGWGARYDGLNRVNGLDPSDNRNPSRRASRLVNGEDLDLEIRVRPGKITVLVNARPHIELDTRAHQLSVLDDIRKRFGDGLGLYVVNGAIDVTSWTIEEVKAEGLLAEASCRHASDYRCPGAPKAKRRFWTVSENSCKAAGGQWVDDNNCPGNAPVPYASCCVVF